MKFSDWLFKLIFGKAAYIKAETVIDGGSEQSLISKRSAIDGEAVAAVIARDLGIKQAEDSANSKNKGWSDLAYGFLLAYTKAHSEFMIEDIRTSSSGLIPEPPSKRAWGCIAVRAAKEGIISRKRFQSVKNIKAHRTPATLWKVNY